MKKISLEKYFVALSKDSLIYGLGNAILKILALITAPILTRIFAPSDYGVISLVSSVVSFLSIFLIFGMDAALFVSYYQYQKERKKVIASAFWFLCTWGLLLIFIAVFSSGYISILFFKTTSFKILFVIAFFTAIINILISISKVVLRLEFRAKNFALISIINAVLTTALIIIFVLYFRKGLLGYFEGQFIGSLITIILTIFFIKNNLKLTISFPRLKEMLSYGLMVVPSSISFFVFDLSDRFFLNHYRTLGELGLYSIGINISGILVFFSYALNQAWSPQITKIYFESKKVFHQFTPVFLTYYLTFFFTLAIFVSIFGLEILKIFATPKYYDAAEVIGPLTVAMVFSASGQVTALGITISRKTKYLALCTFFAAILNIIFNFLLIPGYGIVGAGWATAISYFFLTAAYLWFGQKLIYLKIDWRKILKILILGLTIITLAPFSWVFGFWANFVIKIGEFASFVFLLYFIGIIEKHEINSFRMLWVKIFAKIKTLRRKK